MISRSALGRLHPSFMGGENLPDRRETEVEIAHINIDSTTSDATSVHAKAGKHRILYRFVDEYGGDTLTAKRTRSSKRPLSLGELINLDRARLMTPKARTYLHPATEFSSQIDIEMPTKKKEHPSGD